ncbi:hypothetical protein [Streptomyces neyagawaensis]|uniref:hypothetical protein n=1 Tax=Streptomyces neyagawaensis TaxID=42238 RepID=UPI00201D1AC3|nr:hypothetical protein [Streptomyces neyagawaensis]MCL6737567.1 hypothetical protein [Streptomyces neyagawaensis]MDE1689016.1 hypothetical protein [Streptomyces neyagawaensis]
MTTTDDGSHDISALVLGDGTPVARDGEPLGEGGYGDVWALRERPDLAAKIYKRSPNEPQLRRLTAMLRARPLAEEKLQPGQPPLLAWPTDLIESGGRPVGYGMPRLEPSAHTPLKGLLQKHVRLHRLDGATDWKFLLGVAANLAYMTARLHVEGFVVGDLSSANAVADRSGYITLLDCDSFAFKDALTGEDFGSDAFTDDYACPERHNGTQPTRHSDDFALAVLVYQLLTAGNHPFDGAPKYGSEESTRKDNIVTGTSFLVHPDRVVLPAHLLPPAVVPPAVLRLARATFGPGLREPARRPSSAAWLAALDDVREDVAQCSQVPAHSYGGHLGVCPWCRRLAEGQSDPFTRSHGRAGAAGASSASASANGYASPSRPVSSPAGPSRTGPSGAAASTSARSRPTAAGRPASAASKASAGSRTAAPGSAGPGSPAQGPAGPAGPSSTGPSTTGPSRSGPTRSGPARNGTGPSDSAQAAAPPPPPPTRSPGAPAPKPGAATGSGNGDSAALAVGCGMLLVALALLGLIVWGIVAVL